MKNLVVAGVGVVALVLVLLSFRGEPAPPEAPPAQTEAPEPRPVTKAPSPAPESRRAPLPVSDEDPEDRVSPRASGSSIPPVDPSKFPPIRTEDPESEDAEVALAELPTFAELPERLRPGAMRDFGFHVEELVVDAMPEESDVRLDGVDCSAVPCIVRFSWRADTASSAPLGPVIAGMATDAAAPGDRPILIDGGDGERDSVGIAFTPGESPELAGVLGEAVEGRSP